MVKHQNQQKCLKLHEFNKIFKNKETLTKKKNILVRHFYSKGNINMLRYRVIDARETFRELKLDYLKLKVID